MLLSPSVCGVSMHKTLFLMLPPSVRGFNTLICRGLNINNDYSQNNTPGINFKKKKVKILN
jgi:hypothetical protein